MTPNKKENNTMSYMTVGANGSLIGDVNETSQLFLRPVLTLNRKTEVTGSGTAEDPYRLL